MEKKKKKKSTVEAVSFSDSDSEVVIIEEVQEESPVEAVKEPEVKERVNPGKAIIESKLKMIGR